MFFNPKITDEERRKGRLIQRGAIRKWRNNVFEKSCWQCVICGSKELLVAHHKNAWGKYKKQRFVVENGEAICKRCHVCFHKAYGQGNNTSEQWMQFKNKIKNKVITLPASYEIGQYAVSVGEKYNRLTILEWYKNKNGSSMWKCRCDCGKETIVKGSYLKSGQVKSCGCLVRETRKLKHVY
jgi:hypothetical protein